MTEQNSTLLLLSDDSVVRDVMARSTEGVASLVSCRSAEDAFAQLAAESPAIVLLDTQFEDMPTWKIADRLRRLHSDVELVLIVGDDGGEEADDELREGWLVGVVARGSSERAMRSALMRLLANHRTRAENRALSASLQVLEQCRRLMACLEPGRGLSCGPRYRARVA